MLDEAIQVFQEHPDGALIQNQLQSITNEYKDTMGEGIEAIGNGNWQESLRYFKRAGELNPGLSRITELIDFVSNVSHQVGAARARVDAATQRQDWDNATSLARAIDRYVNNVKSMVVGLRNQDQRL
jgi:hypothetical protein